MSECHMTWNQIDSFRPINATIFSTKIFSCLGKFKFVNNCGQKTDGGEWVAGCWVLITGPGVDGRW